jgi:hypothetical protein
MLNLLNFDDFNQILNDFDVAFRKTELGAKPA